MPVYTTAITGSTGAPLAFSGSVELTTGFLSTAGVANASIIYHPTTIPANFNSLLYGPITLKHSGSLRISANSAVKIKDLEDV